MADVMHWVHASPLPTVSLSINQLTIDDFGLYNPLGSSRLQRCRVLIHPPWLSRFASLYTLLTGIVAGDIYHFLPVLQDGL